MHTHSYASNSSGAVQVAGRLFRAHKVILAAHSTYFNMLLNSGFEEGARDGGQPFLHALLCLHPALLAVQPRVGRL